MKERSSTRKETHSTPGRATASQLRFHGSQLVDPDHLVYRRLDGTLSHFFDISDLIGLFVDAGYQQEEAKYCTVSLRNKKKDLAMRRVFVHGVFRAGHP
jgi:hypothetical protein